MNKKIKKVYLAGSITKRLKTYKAVFEDVSSQLKNKGFLVMSPHILPIGFEWSDYMEITREMQKACDCMYVLKNWEESEGTIIEINWAKLSGMPIYYQEEDTPEFSFIIDNFKEI